MERRHYQEERTFDLGLKQQDVAGLGGEVVTQARVEKA